MDFKDRWEYSDLVEEMERQDAKWGEQNHPDGTEVSIYKPHADYARSECEKAFAAGKGTWLHILREEVLEAFAEEDREKLKNELLQIAAVCIQWRRAIDRRPPDDIHGV